MNLGQLRHEDGEVVEGLGVVRSDNIRDLGCTNILFQPGIPVLPDKLEENVGEGLVGKVSAAWPEEGIGFITLRHLGKRPEGRLYRVQCEVEVVRDIIVW